MLEGKKFLWYGWGDESDWAMQVHGTSELSLFSPGPGSRGRCVRASLGARNRAVGAVNPTGRLLCIERRTFSNDSPHLLNGR
jgi:hypothetical protein